jgi:hypothetical protein
MKVSTLVDASIRSGAMIVGNGTIRDRTLVPVIPLSDITLAVDVLVQLTYVSKLEVLIDLPKNKLLVSINRVGPHRASRQQAKQNRRIIRDALYRWEFPVDDLLWKCDSNLCSDVIATNQSNLYSKEFK